MIRSMLLLFALAGSPAGLAANADADDAAFRAANQLLELTGMEESMDKVIQGMLDMQLQQNPQLADRREALLAFFARHMSFASLKADMARIYARSFTTGELEELVAFYRTPTGRKTLDMMPALMQEGADLGVARLQANIGELQAILAEPASTPAESRGETSRGE